MPDRRLRSRSSAAPAGSPSARGKELDAATTHDGGSSLERDTIAKYHPVPIISGEVGLPPWKESRSKWDLSTDLARSLHEPFNLPCEVLDLVLHINYHRTDEELIKYFRPTQAVDDLEEGMASPLRENSDRAFPSAAV
jgi:hypothetical protein